MTHSADERASASTAPRALGALDAWMAANPWHPRVLPFLVFILMLPIIQWAGSGWPQATVPFHVLQVVLVAGLLWRYRRLLPELNWRFHWLAVPVAVVLCAVWVGLGHLMAHAWPQWFAPERGTHAIARMPDGWRWTSLAVRMVSMVLVVPMFEELFVRSACLRGLHSPRKTWIGLVQVAVDLPLLGDWLMETRYGRRMERYPSMFTRQLREWPVGQLTWFGVCASTLVFTVNHMMRDWPAAVICGVAWCGLLWWTNQRRRGAMTADGEAKPALGLGPVVWSHAITNALLIAWCVMTGQWWFL